MDEDDSQEKSKAATLASAAAAKKRKPKVIRKLPPTKMSEDGSNGGGRCIDLYKIVDKEGREFGGKKEKKKREDKIKKLNLQLNIRRVY